MQPAIPKRKFTAAELVPGRSYQVISPFTDFDGITHATGEQWRFLRKNFLPYEDGLSLFVEENGREVHIRLQWRPDAQQKIIDGFSALVEEL